MLEGWTCSRCSSGNPEASVVCATCGATRPDDDVAVSGDAAPETPETPAAADGGVGWAAITTPAATPPPAATPAVAPTAMPTADQGIVGWVAPDGTTPPPAAPVAKPLWQRLPVGWIVIGVIVGAGAIGGALLNAGRSSTGEINKPGDLTAADIRVGDCFDLKDATATEIEKVTARPCADAHEYEMIFVGSLPTGTYPPDSVFGTYVDTNCDPAFAAYIGTPFRSTTLGVYYLVPTEDAWKDGDRAVQCAVHDPGNKALKGSLRGSKR